MAKAYQDTFVRTAAGLDGSTASDGLFTWDVPFGTDPTTNGTALPFVASFTAIASADCDTDATYAEIDYVHTSGVPTLWLGLGSNGTYPGAGSTGYEFAIFGGDANIYAVDDGAFTLLATVSFAATDGTYRATRNGAALAFYRNGVLILSATDSSEPVGPGNRRAYIGGDIGAVTPEFLDFRYGDLSTGTTIAVPAGALGWAGQAPTLAVTGATTIAVPAGAEAWTGQAPTVSTTAHRVAAPGAGALGWAGAVPTVAVGSTGVSIAVPAGAVGWTGQPFGVAFLGPSTGTLVWQGYAPESQAGRFVAPGVGALAWQGYAPTAPQAVVAAPGAGALGWTGYALEIQAGQSPAPAAGALGWAGQTPTLQRTFLVELPAGAVGWSGHAPMLVTGQARPGTGAIAWQGRRPAVINSGQGGGAGTALTSGSYEYEYDLTKVYR